MPADKTATRIFHNSQLQKHMDQAMPWLDHWNDFKHNVELDFEAFESLLREKNIPISAWVATGGNGFLGWAALRGGGKQPLRLLFKPTEREPPKPLVDCGLETKVMVFPYLPELSYLLCTKIKLAHVSHSGMEHYGQTILGVPEPAPAHGAAKPQPTKIFRYT